MSNNSLLQLTTVASISLLTGCCIGALLTLPKVNQSKSSSSSSTSPSATSTSTSTTSSSSYSSESASNSSTPQVSRSPRDQLSSLISAITPKPLDTQTQSQSQPSKQISTSPSTTDYLSDDESDDDDDDDEDEEFIEIDSKPLNDIPGECRLALVVRTDLGMQKGKIAAQCCHAAVACYRLISNSTSDAYNPELLNRWLFKGQAKITLKCNSMDEMDLLFAKAVSLNVNAYVVHDAGRTQIEAGSATVLGLGPAPKSILDQITGDLKLY